MEHKVAYQRCFWDAQPLADVPVAGWLQAEVSSGALRLTGWALATVGELELLEARSLSATATTDIDRPSPDVEPLAPAVPKAANCRFELLVPLGGDAVGNLDWTLWTVDQAGQPRHFGTVLLEPTLSSDRPVFVVGAARSGTTAVGDGIRMVKGLTGYGEGHTMPVLTALREGVDRYYSGPNASVAATNGEVLLGHVRPEEWRVRTARSMRFVYHQLHRGEFIDKTPGTEMLNSLPIAMSIWPEARVIFCRRRGLENVDSRRRKFPEQDFVGHCQDWTVAMLTWHELDSTVPEAQRMEIDQHELAADPAAASERLGQFVGLDSTQRDRLREYLETSAPERTSEDWHPVRARRALVVGDRA